MEKICKTCANCLKAELPGEIRCGLEYFAKPPSERKPERLDHYPLVTATDSCASWASEASAAHRPGQGT